MLFSSVSCKPRLCSWEFSSFFLESHVQGPPLKALRISPEESRIFSAQRNFQSLAIYFLSELCACLCSLNCKYLVSQMRSYISLCFSGGKLRAGCTARLVDAAGVKGHCAYHCSAAGLPCDLSRSLPPSPPSHSTDPLGVGFHVHCLTQLGLLEYSM